MKIAPSYISRERLIKKAAERAKERIAEYTNVSSAFRPEDTKVLKESLDPISRYANRHNINVDFEPSVDEMGATKMNIYKRSVKWMDFYDGTQSTPYLGLDYAGDAIISKNIDNKHDFLQKFRNEAARILYKK